MSPPITHAVLHGIRWTTAARVLAQLFTWASTFWVVRLLSPVDYGLVAIATLVTGYLAIWNELGIGVTLVQKRVTDEVTLRKVFTLLLLVGVVLCGVALALAPTIAALFKEPRVVGLSCLASLHFLLMPFYVIPQSRLSMDMCFKAIGATNVAASLAGAVATVTLANLEFGAYSLVLGTLTQGVVRTATTAWLARVPLRPTTSLRGLGGISSFSGAVLLERTIWYAYSEADIFIVGRTLGPANLGAYTLGRQLAQMPMERASEIMNVVALPAYAAIKEDISRVRNGYFKALRLGSLTMFPIFWGLAAIADDLFPLLLGPKWIESIPVFQLLCLVMALRSLGTLTSPLLTALGRMRDVIGYVAWPALLVPAALLVGVRWGVIGAALAWCLAYPPAFLLSARRLCTAIGSNLGELARAIAMPAGIAGAMLLMLFGIGELLPHNTPAALRLGIEVAAGAGIYLGLLRFAAPALHFEGRTMLGSLLRKN